MGPQVQGCFADMHSFLRAIALGYVELTPEIRAELTEMVREVTEIIMHHDLE